MANKVKLNVESAITFAPSGGSYAFTLTSLGNNAGRISARADLGDYPRPGFYRWFGKTKAASTSGLAVGSFLEFSLVLWDDETGIADPAGAHGATDAAMATENYIRNTVPVGALECDEVSTSRSFQRVGTIFIPSRYVSVLAWNRLGAALSGTASDHLFRLTPMMDEIP